MMSCHGNASCNGSQEPYASDLFPSIFQCFIIILLGYLSARFGLLNASNAKGLNSYISNFALPALFFQAICTIDFSGVNWRFLGAIYLGKTIIFFTTVIIVISLTRPVSLSKSGIFAIFVSQSNDVALGFPILRALLPKLAHYIYLVAPMQLVVLNPIGFVLMEIQSHRDNRSQNQAVEATTSGTQRDRRGLGCRCGDSIVWRVFSGVMLNPLIFMTLMGVPFNFIFQRKIPPVFNMALTVLAQSFSGTALFVLGFNMLGKLTSLCRRTALLITALLLAKLVILPFLMYQLVEIFHPPGANTTSFRFFAFLYGAIPTAPTVFLFASNYHAAVDIIASGLVLGTFISFPWTFLSARLVSLSVIKESDYGQVIRSTSLNISILSFICVLWVLVIFFLSRRFRRMPHAFTTGYLFFLLLTSVGLVSAHLSSGSQFSSASSYATFIIFFTGTTGARVWVLIIALALVLLKTKGLCFVLYYRWALTTAGCCFPVAVTGILLMFDSSREPDQDPAFQFGKNQLIVSSVMLFACLIGLLGCVFVLLRHENAHRANEQARLANQLSDSSPCVTTEDDSQSLTAGNSSLDTAVVSSGEASADEETLLFGDDGLPDDEMLDEWLRTRRCLLYSHNATPDMQRSCHRNLIHYRRSTRSFLEEAGEAGLGDVDKEYQTYRHMLLFVVSCISMFMGILLCVWRLVNESLSGIYLMLEFLDSFCNYGQGIFMSALFGVDTDLIILPCKKRWRKLLYGVEEVHIPSEEQLDPEIVLIREHFVRHHLRKCKDDLVDKHSFNADKSPKLFLRTSGLIERRYHLVVYDDVFRGDLFIAWLQSEGLASSEVEALAMGQKLLYGRVFYHVKREHHLHNLPYFYRFSHEFDHLIAEETGALVDLSHPRGDERETSRHRH